MFRQEAVWLGQRIHAMDPSQVFPLLDVGSSDERFRTRVQPWVDDCLFAPARHRGLVVAHTDIKNAPGVDLVGDLLDNDFIHQLAGMGFRALLCTSLLEHVANQL